jgi:hypothetical protein
MYDNKYPEVDDVVMVQVGVLVVCLAADPQLCLHEGSCRLIEFFRHV